MVPNKLILNITVWKTVTSIFFENLLRKFKFHYNLTVIIGTLHEDQYTYLAQFFQE